MGKSWVTFSRYIFNTVFITVVGTFGHLIIASMGAFVLAKYDFPGSKLFFNIVVTALMFNGYVTAIPNYLIISKLGWIDTYWAIIIPAFAAPMGLFLMKQFMEGIPMSLVEAAKIDGASQWRIFINIVMPNVKPAWLTLIIFRFKICGITRLQHLFIRKRKRHLFMHFSRFKAEELQGQVRRQP